MTHPVRMLIIACAAFLTAFSVRAEAQKTAFRFVFGQGSEVPGCVRVLSDALYTNERGYGFEPGGKVNSLNGFCSSDTPFFFSVALPEGNYNVSVTLGGAEGESTLTVKAESRRLMLEQVRTAPGKIETRTFTVNIRTPRISSGGEVHLKKRELDYLHWDNKLTLEFSGPRTAVRALEIARNDDALTVYLAGDSTVTDQPHEPWNSWGQMLPCFFKPGVAIANHAESGESLKSFTGSKRLEKILSTIKKGDYLFIQFGHNDQKDKTPGAGAFTTYKTELKRYVAEARSHGATPVLITPVSRRSFGTDGKIANNLGDFPEAVRQAAKEDNVPLIDLNAMSIPFYEALGLEKSKLAFVDNTHHTDYGSYELAKCIVEGIRQNKLGLVKFIADDWLPFDPAHPDPVESFNVPPSPGNPGAKPEGN